MNNQGIIVIFLGLMQVSTPKVQGKLHHALLYIKFSLRFWCGFLHQTPKHYNDSLSFYLVVLKAYFDFDVSVANDVAIVVAKCALMGKVMQGSLAWTWHFNQRKCALHNEILKLINIYW